MAETSRAAAQIVTPGVYITMPPDEDAEEEQGLLLGAAAGVPAALAGGENTHLSFRNQRSVLASKWPSDMAFR